MPQTKENEIRMMFGIGNNIRQGFSIVYEGAHDAACSMNIWYDGPLFVRVRFVDEGSSRIVWEEFDEVVSVFTSKIKKSWGGQKNLDPSRHSAKVKKPKTQSRSSSGLLFYFYLF